MDIPRSRLTAGNPLTPIQHELGLVKKSILVFFYVKRLSLWLVGLVAKTKCNENMLSLDCLYLCNRTTTHLNLVLLYRRKKPFLDHIRFARADGEIVAPRIMQSELNSALREAFKEAYLGRKFIDSSESCRV